MRWLFPLLLAVSAVAADPWPALAEAAGKADAVEQRKALEALLLEQPGFHAAHFNLGCLLLASDQAAASSHLETATGAAEPELAADAWFNLALLRYQQGRLPEAVTDAGKALELRPDHADSRQLRDELRRVMLARQDEARRQAEEEAKKLGLAETTLPEAHVGEAYDHRLQARGGAGGWRFSMGVAPAASAPPPAPPAGNRPPATPPPPAKDEPAAPPPGLALEADGRLHGTPEKPGRFELPLVIKDAQDATAQGTAVLVVVPAPVITTTSLPEGVRDIGYLADLACAGLVEPRWTVTGLPDGLAAPTGRGATVKLAGTPRVAGEFPLRVTASDDQRRATAQLTLTVAEAFAPEETVLPPATAWAAYRHQVGVRGPAQAYRWSGAGAGGLAVAADGTVGGTPEKAGAVPLGVTITAADGKSRAATLTVPVNPPPLIKEAEPIQLTQGQPVNRPLRVEGGTPDYQWHVADGLLPRGLRLDPDGGLRGAVTAPGKTEVTVAVADRWRASTQQKLVIEVKPNENPPPQQDQQKQQPQASQAQQQQGQGQERKDQDQQQQDGKDQADKDRQAKEQAARQDAERQAEQLNKAATDRWLDQLPPEDRKALLRQLLEGGKPQQKGRPW